MLFHEARPPTREGMVENPIIDHLSALLEQGWRAKAWSVDDARLTAVFLFSGMHGIVDDAHLKEKRVARSRLVKRLQHICFRTVGLHSADS